MSAFGRRGRIRWAIGAAALLATLGVIAFGPLPSLSRAGPAFAPFFIRCLYVLVLCLVLCLYRILRGPTVPDRAVAIDIMGIVVVGFCAVLCVPTGQEWYIDIGIAWALQSFIATLALAKYLEGKPLDE